jgi:hypothetical protein
MKIRMNRLMRGLVVAGVMLTAGLALAQERQGAPGGRTRRSPAAAGAVQRRRR